MLVHLSVIQWIGTILTILYGAFLIVSVRRIDNQIDNWLMVLNLIAGALMILTILRPMLGILGLLLEIPVALLNGRLIFNNINWSNFVVRCVVSAILIVVLVV